MADENKKLPYQEEDDTTAEDLNVGEGDDFEEYDFSEDDDTADLVDSLNERPVKREKLEKKEKIEEASGPEPEKLVRQDQPATQREPDPLQRQVNPQEAANRMPDSRTATEFGQAGREAEQVASSGAKAAEAGAKAAQTGVKAVESGAKAVQTGVKAAEAGVKTAEAGAKAAGAATKAGALIARISALAAQAVAFLVANWEIILIVLVGLLIFAGISFGLSALIGDEISSGRLGGTIAQPANVSEPKVKEAINNLAFLAGQEDAVREVTTEELEKIRGYIGDIETGIAENTAAQAILGTSLTEVKTNLETVLANSANKQSANLVKLFQSIDQLLMTTYGVTAKQPSEVSVRARDAFNARDSWIGSTNELITNATKPMRDGSNTVNGKKGCDASGFIVYLLRPATGNCLICATANLDTLAKTYSFALQAESPGEDFDLTTLQDGDITISEREGAKGAQVFSKSDNNVYYCSANEGLLSAPAASFYGGNRTVTNVLRLKKLQ